MAESFQPLAIQQFIIFSVLIGLWAFLRPGFVRDFSERKLPYNFAARCSLVALYWVAFAVLVLVLHLAALEIGAAQITTTIQNAPMAIANSLSGQAPMLGIAIFMAAKTAASYFFRDLERSLIVSLHSAKHLKSDADLLTQHLMICDFEPSEIERANNIQTLRDHGVYLKHGERWNFRMVTVGNWRKVSSLLRLLQGWAPQLGTLLTDADRRTLHDMADAHGRKTKLAMTIVKMMEMTAEGRQSPAALSEVMRQLTSVPQLDREKVSSAEAAAGTLLDASGSIASAIAHDAVRVSSLDLRDHLRQIEHYFETEYDILLERCARLVATAITQSADLAPKRLEELKVLGFYGLGSVETINLDRILQLFLFGSLGGFSVLLAGNLANIGHGAGQLQPIVIAQFAVSMAVAALVGALFGEDRRFAVAPTPPWAAYIVAGTVSAILYVAIGIIMKFVRFDLLHETVQPGTLVPTLPRMLAWSALPFITTMGICILSRIKSWPEAPLLPRAVFVERFVDGAALSGLLYCGFVLSIALNLLFGETLPPRIQALLADSGRWLTIPVIWPLQILGFGIGFFFIRVVRQAAHATIIDTEAMRANPGPIVLEGEIKTVRDLPSPAVTVAP